MADNWQAVDGAGAAVTIAADEISSAKHQRVKISLGADGAGVDLEQFTQAEDAAHVSGDRGVMLLAVRKDTAAALAGADGDYIPVIVDASGRLHVMDRSTGQDDAVGPGYAAAVGGVYQATVDEVDANDVGIVRMSPRRALVGAADYRTLSLSASTPVPSGSDITNSAGNALTSADFEIRDTNAHFIMIPVASAGWRHVTVVWQVTAFDQAATIYTRRENFGIASYVTLPAGDTQFVICDAGAVGQGGYAGGASVSAYAVYSIPALEYAGHILLRIAFAVAPTTGSLSLEVKRCS